MNVRAKGKQRAEEQAMMKACINLFRPKKISSVRCTKKIKSDRAKKNAKFVTRKASDHGMTKLESEKR